MTLSPVLFNIVLEKVVREVALDKEGVKLGENNIWNIGMCRRYSLDGRKQR